MKEEEEQKKETESKGLTSDDLAKLEKAVDSEPK